MLKTSIIILVQILVFILPGYSQTLPKETAEHIKTLSNQEKVDYLGDLCWSLREEKNEEAILYGRYALALADSFGLYSSAAKISNYLGVSMLYYVYDTRQAWNYFRGAMTYGAQSKDSIQIGYAYDNMGYLYLFYNDNSSALEYLEIAEKTFSSLKFDQGLAYVYSNLGLVYQAKKEFSRAFEYFNRAKLLHTKNKNEIGITAAFLCMAETFQFKNEPDSALFYYQEQLRFAEKNNQKKYIAQGLNGKANVLYQLEKYEEALALCNRAMELSIEKKDYSLMIDIRITKALILSKLGKVFEGEKELQDALELANKLRFPKSIFNVGSGYSLFYNNVGYSKNAPNVFQELVTLYGSIYDDLRNETIKNENHQFQISVDLEKAKIELSNKKSREKLYYIIIFLMVAIGVIHFSRYRAKQALYKKLQQKNKEIEQEINYKNKALDALALSEKELKISNAAKDKFFSIIAHDLKSPFSAILGFSELLSEQPENFDEEHRNQMIHHINDTAKRTYHLLENLLVWASAQTNRLIYQPQIINLKTIIDENVALQQPGAKKKNISMKNTLKGDLFVFADKDMLSTIFRNFLSNAIKFTSEQGIISIGAREIQEERKMQVWIEDSGVGISAEDLPTLFDLSKVKTNPGTRNEKGTGLGLAICKEFIELHNGTITVESQPGKGSIFRFTLPLTETK